MNTGKKLGIWMDHSKAHLVELIGSLEATKTIDSTISDEDNEHSTSKSENVMHNKEQHKQAAFYKKLKAEIRNFEEVLLFGPSTAIEELANLLKADHQFDKIKVDVKHAGKMSDSQQHTFVKEHFFKALS